MDLQEWKVNKIMSKLKQVWQLIIFNIWSTNLTSHLLCVVEWFSNSSNNNRWILWFRIENFRTWVNRRWSPCKKLYLHKWVIMKISTLMMIRQKDSSKLNRTTMEVWWVCLTTCSDLVTDRITTIIITSEGNERIKS